MALYALRFQELEEVPERLLRNVQRRDLPGRAGERIGGGRLEPRLSEVDSRLVAGIAFDTDRDPVHHLHRFARILAGRAFRR